MSFWQGFKYVIKAKTYLLLLNPVLWVWMGLAVVQVRCAQSAAHACLSHHRTSISCT